MLKQILKKQEEREKRRLAKTSSVKVKPKTLGFDDTVKMRHFNKVFKENVHLAMYSSVLKDTFLTYNVSVTKVKVTPTFSEVFVYWTTATGKNNLDMDTVSRDIDASASDVRYELSRMQVLGLVPKITFLKDFDMAQNELMDNLAAVKEPPLSACDDNDSDEDEDQTRLELVSEVWPLKTNILGLDTSVITRNVIEAVERAKASHRTNKRDD